MDIEVNRLTEIAIYTGEEPDENSIWIDDTTDARIQAGTLYLNRAIVDTDIQFGQLISGEFRVTIFNLGENVVGRKIKVWIYENNLRSELFTGTIDSAKHDHNNNYREIVAYDWAYEYRNINVADFWNDFWETNKDAQEIRLDWFRSCLLDYLDIMGGAGSLYNDDLNIANGLGNQYNKVKTLTFESMLIMICELQCAFPYVNAGGALDFVTLDNSNVVDLRDRKYQGDISDWEDFAFQPITGIAVWKNSSDMFFYKGASDRAHPYNITANLILNQFQPDRQESIVMGLVTQMNHITYIPCSIKMIVSDLDLELGQRIRTEKGYSYIMSNEISGSFFVEQTLESRASGSSLRLEGSTYNDGMVNQQTISTMEVEVKSGSVKYQHASNLYAVNIGSGAKKQVINLRFLNDIETIVIFQAEILLQTDNTTDGQPTIAKVSYRLNEVEDTEYYPIEEWVEDGHHILSLFYPIQLESAGSNHFEVYIEATDGSILIPANKARGWVYGAGIMASAPEWNGTINAEDNLYGYEADITGITSIGGMTSTVSQSQVTPHTRALQDTVSAIDIDGVTVAGISDILQINKDPLTNLTWGEVGAYTWGQISDNYMW